MGYPRALPTAPEVDPDIVLVPMLAFDAKGCRLGYGGGYYDRTLALRKRKSVVVVGFAYDEQKSTRFLISIMTSASTGC